MNMPVEICLFDSDLAAFRPAGIGCFDFCVFDFDFGLERKSVVERMSKIDDEAMEIEPSPD